MRSILDVAHEFNHDAEHVDIHLFRYGVCPRAVPGRTCRWRKKGY